MAEKETETGAVSSNAALSLGGEPPDDIREALKNDIARKVKQKKVEFEADRVKKNEEREEERQALEGKLASALANKVAFEEERKRLDEELKQQKELEAAEKQFRIINSVVVPPKGTRLD